MKNGDYILIEAPEDYPGKKYRGKYCYKHHYVWWKKHKTLPKDGEIIHHKDENKHNNALSNLELITDDEHNGDKHKAEKGWKELKCSNPKCKKKFTIEERKYNGKWEEGQRQFYCSRSCMATHSNSKRSFTEDEFKKIVKIVVAKLKKD